MVMQNVEAEGAMGLTIAAVLLGSAAVFYVDFVLELSSLALLCACKNNAHSLPRALSPPPHNILSATSPCSPVPHAADGTAVVGLFSASMWMPYLMALIYYNGLWKKLNYEPLTAAKPDWVGRAVVAHNNSLENFMLFGIAVILATLLQIPDVETVLWCKLYFAMRSVPGASKCPLFP